MTHISSSTVTVTDMFCGAGGSTTGSVLAGADVKLAINHWKRAIETHNTNYPNTKHALTDLHKASPRRFPSTTILIASPECTSHSLAKGQRRTNQKMLSLWDTGESSLEAEAEERSRCTMWTPLDWAEWHDYQAVILENVVDAHLWRPFESWLHAWRSLDYDYEIVYLNSMYAHPTPQSRDRMYFVAWKRGNTKPNLQITPEAYCSTCEKDIKAVQSWKKPTRRYGKYRQQYIYCCPGCSCEVTPYYYAAANAIDWTIPAPKIGERAKPLREKTLLRIEYGLRKFAEQPFTVQVDKSTDRVRSTLSDVFPTQTATNDLAKVSPFLVRVSHANANGGRFFSVQERAFPTLTGRDDLRLVMPFIAELHGTSKARSITEPLATVCASGSHHGLVIPPGNHWLMSYYNNGQLASITNPVPTVTTLERHALVTSSTMPASVDECGFRMLVPKEIQAAMAFPPDYIITGNKSEQVKQLGNAVTPPVMKLLMERVIASLGYSSGEEAVA